ncbi:MAG: hypothetical protein WAO24_08185 [Peptococcia bacterium]
MIKEQAEKLEMLIKDSFNDALERELRLSTEELEYLQNKYPKATIEPMESEESTDNKSWYLVKFNQ